MGQSLEHLDYMITAHSLVVEELKKELDSHLKSSSVANLATKALLGIT